MGCYSSLAAAAAVLLLAGPAHAGFYGAGSSVLEINAKTYDRHIVQTNYTSIVEFYAPWCGHCKNLQPAYEKAAKSLKGLAKVAAVNCDDDLNKAFCSTMGVQGFPTLKIVRPGKKKNRPMVEEYRGGRTAKSIVETIVEKIPNHVDKLTSPKVDEWFKDSNETAKALLFTKKGATSALYRSLAIDFLGSIKFGQIRNSEVAVDEVFGVTEFPKLILLPGGDKEAIVYEGELKKELMSAFLSQIAKPNQDPPPVQKKSKTKSDKKAKKGGKAQKVVQEEKAEKTEEKAEEKAPIKEAEDEATESVESSRPDPLPFLETTEALREKCFNPTAGTCLIALLPDIGAEEEFSHTVIEGLTSLAAIKQKYKKSKAAIFPFYAVPGENEVNTYLRKSLAVGNKRVMGNAAAFEIFIVNAKRGWWRRYRSEVGPESGFNVPDIENWIDHVKSGVGQKPVPKRPAAEGEKATQKESDAEAVADVIDNLKPGSEKSASEDKIAEDQQPESEPEKPAQAEHDDL